MKPKSPVIMLFFAFILVFQSCKNSVDNNVKKSDTLQIIEKNQIDLRELLETKDLDSKQRYAIINQMSQNLLSVKDFQSTILFLTEWIEQNPDDMYNAYWLLITAYSYLSTGAEPVAEYYFDRILQKNQDLLVKGTSIHLMCLQNLIQISKTPANRIKYFNELINRFPQNINLTEIYLRLAMEYEKDNQWEQALKTYNLFLSQPDASTIQIPGEPDAYKNARHFVDFSRSSKDWTFESLPALEAAIKKAIKNYDWRTLDKYRAKVNFFSMSWKQDETDANSQEEFSMHDWMTGRNRIRFNENLDESSNPNEAYLRTWGWNNYVSVWYLYFRKVNYPLDPDINGNWEWAGIYIGNKL